MNAQSIEFATPTAAPSFGNAVFVPPGGAGAIPNIPFYVRLALNVMSHLAKGSITMVLPDGRAFRMQGEAPGKDGVMIIHNYRAIRRLMTGGSLGFAEAYIDGEWDSPDVEALLETATAEGSRVQDRIATSWWYRALNRAVHIMRSNTKWRAKKNISAHYDLGNAFYERWLDKTMTYSSARFEKPGQSLSEAQTAKYRSLAERIELQPDQSVLEIGSGWGGFAEFAAKEIGCKVTGITISREQLEFAQRRMFENGLNEKVEIRFQDYRDVEGTYDRIASIEMFEAVGERYWPAFFGKLRDTLKAGGRAGLQIITIGDEHFDSYRKSVDFVQRYIFPGGMLPSITALKDQVARVGMRWDGNFDFGIDYADTLAAWRTRFLNAWDDIKPLGFDERFKRLWSFYLSYCEAGFRVGSIDVTQVSLTRA